MTDSATKEIVRSRRAVLAAAAGGAAALAASALGPASVAAAVGNMQTETDNATTAPTAATLLAAGGVKVHRGKRTGSSKSLVHLIAAAKAGAMGRKADSTRVQAKLAALRADIRTARARD